MGEEEKNLPARDAKAGSNNLIIGVLLFLVAVLGMSLFIVIFFHDAKGLSRPSPAENRRKTEKAKPGILVPLGGEIIVNLAEAGGATYLKVNPVLEVDNPKTAEEIKLRSPQIRDLIIGILRLKTVEKISEKEGINQIRGEIISGINRCLSEGKVTNLYFSDFIMQ